MKNEKVKKVSLFGMFSALAMAISFLESLIPPILPVPAFKPGLSNIVTMFCVNSLGGVYGLAVTVFKAFFALITRGVTAFFMSLTGGLFSLFIMVIIFKFGKKTFGYIGIGVLCAVFHNVGQLIVAVVYLGKEIMALSPVLLLTGIVTGVVTGTVFKYTVPVLDKLYKNIFRGEV